MITQKAKDNETCMSTSQLHIVVTTVAARRNFLSDCFFVERMSYKYCRRGEASTAIGYGTVLGAPEFVGLVGLSSTTQSKPRWTCSWSPDHEKQRLCITKSQIMPFGAAL